MRTSTVVHVIDEDEVGLGILKRQLQNAGLICCAYDDPRAFLAIAPTLTQGCVLANLRMNRIDGLRVMSYLRSVECTLPVLFMAERSDVEAIVEAVKQGAIDVILKPLDPQRLKQTVLVAAEARRKLEQVAENAGAKAPRAEIETLPARAKNSDAASRIAALPPRCRDVLEGVAEGLSAKIIASRLGISPRTVENHKVNMLHRLGARHTADAIRMAVEAGLLDKCA